MTTIMSKKKIIGLAAFTMATAAIMFTASTAFAEGSRNIMESAGGQGVRPLLYKRYSSDSLPKHLNQVFYVYANEGENLHIGTYVVSEQAVVITTPSGEKIVLESTEETGHIATVEQEAAGPNGVILSGNEVSTTDGYNPIIYAAQETGVYRIDFEKIDVDGTVGDNPFTSAKETSSLVAFDVTVAKDDMREIPGRMYAENLTFWSDGRQYSKYYVLTKDGYVYYADLNGMTGYETQFWGTYSSMLSTKQSDSFNQPLYHSIGITNGEKGPKPLVSDYMEIKNKLGKTDGAFLNGGETIVDGENRNGLLVNLAFEPGDNCKIFFEYPSEDLPKSIKADRHEFGTISDFTFDGGIYENGEIVDGKAYVGLGGTFHFNCSNTAAYQIQLDLSNIYYNRITDENKIDTAGDFVIKCEDGSYENVLTHEKRSDITDEIVASYYNCGQISIGNEAVEGENSCYWDGKDKNGCILPA
ncbi:MAG: hypothetical protein Q4G33_07930, partial [bacterium]|nr:hypothetical protein [bacterium]